jgi:transcriptional regulator with XRE-family HTH domain
MEGKATVTESVPALRRLVGGALRYYRENIGFSLDDAAKTLDCDRSKISRIETGQRGIRPKELRELLTEYGIAGDEQATLLALAPRGRRHGWWDEYAGILPQTFTDYLALEPAAAETMTYQALQVPGLLQTPDYARAIAAADPRYDDDRQVQRAVAAVTAWQEAVLGHARQVSVVVSEAALHQMADGTAVMTAQLTRLAELASGPADLTLQVLPFSAAAHPACGAGSFTVLRFPHLPSPGVVYLDALPAGVWLDDPAAVAAYSRAFALLRASALPPEDTTRLLAETARELNPPWED